VHCVAIDVLKSRIGREIFILFGVIVRHFFGNELVRIWERLLSRVPVARSIYGGVKQLFEAIITTTSTRSTNWRSGEPTSRGTTMTW